MTRHDLNHHNFWKFRPNVEQGLFGECLIPFFFHWVFGTFSEDWIPIQDLFLVYMVLVLGYFRYQLIIPNQYPFWGLAAAWIIYEEFHLKGGVTKYQLTHLVTLFLQTELIPYFLPGAFSVSEFFIFATINSYYTTFCLDSVFYRD